MGRSIKCKAVSPVDGVENILSITGWSRHTGKSTTFLSSMMDEAYKDHRIETVDEQMVYALKQTPGQRQSKKRRILSRDSNAHRKHDESQFRARNRNLIAGFLLRA